MEGEREQEGGTGGRKNIGRERKGGRKSACIMRKKELFVYQVLPEASSASCWS